MVARLSDSQESGAAERVRRSIVDSLVGGFEAYRSQKAGFGGTDSLMSPALHRRHKSSTVEAYIMLSVFHRAVPQQAPREYDVLHRHHDCMRLQLRHQHQQEALRTDSDLRVALAHSRGITSWTAGGQSSYWSLALFHQARTPFALHHSSNFSDRKTFFPAATASARMLLVT